MFPRFREQIGTALDLIVEFSTLGEYRLGTANACPGASGAPAVASGHAPQLGGAGAAPRAAVAGHTGSAAERAAVRRTVAGGAAGCAPVATPAARRREARARAPAARRPEAPSRTRVARRRTSAPFGEQLCLAI